MYLHRHLLRRSKPFLLVDQVAPGLAELRVLGHKLVLEVSSPHFLLLMLLCNRFPFFVFLAYYSMDICCSLEIELGYWRRIAFCMQASEIAAMFLRAWQFLLRNRLLYDIRECSIWLVLLAAFLTIFVGLQLIETDVNQVGELSLRVFTRQP